MAYCPVPGIDTEYQNATPSATVGGCVATVHDTPLLSDQYNLPALKLVLLATHATAYFPVADIDTETQFAVDTPEGWFASVQFVP
jgi:hypothetical protein